MLKAKVIYADLHVHSTASDGTCTPAELVHRACDLGLGAIALTDHDTLSGLAEARLAAQHTHLNLVSGIELSCGWPEMEFSLHVLGLFVDESSVSLLELLDAQRRYRFTRAMEILDKLENLGFQMDELRNRFNASPDKVLGRPHVARYLLEIGAVRDFQEAFEKYLKRGRPAYVPKKPVLPEAGIAAIHGAGGLALIAHPGLIPDWNTVWGMVKDNMWDGMEIRYSEHSSKQMAFFDELAQRNGLLMSGGSDYHGECVDRASKFGMCGLNRDEYEALATAADKRRTKMLLL